EESIGAGGQVVTFNLYGMRKAHDRILIGTRPPGRCLARTEAKVNKSVVRNGRSVNLTFPALYTGTAIGYGHLNDTDLFGHHGFFVSARRRHGEGHNLRSRRD